MVLALSLASLASASTVIIAADGVGANDSIFGLSASTTGSTMIGLLSVTVFFTGGGNSGPTTWSACSSGVFCGQASGAIGNGVWTLTQLGDPGAVTNSTSPDTSAVNPWTLTNTSTTVGIASVALSGIVSPSSGVVFDRDLNTGGQSGTPGSNFGVDYTFKSESGGNSPYTATVTYNNKATIIAAPPCIGFGTNSGVGCGDVWGSVNFSFGSPFIAATTVTPTTWLFFQDTDMVQSPEPITVGITGAGLLTLMIAYRRRRRAS